MFHLALILLALLQAMNGAASAATVAAARAPGGSTRPAARDLKPEQRKAEAEKLIAAGEKALAEADYAAARQFFSDAVDYEPRSVTALHGLGLANVGLNDLKGARIALDSAMEMAARPPSRPERPLVINFAMVQISIKNPMRAVKFLIDYQKASPTPDEAVLNALAVALNTADASARRGAFYKQAVNFYVENNARLEENRPGEKRWGLKWVKEKEYQQLERVWKRDEEQVRQLQDDVDNKATAYAEARRQYARAKYLEKFGNSGYLSVRRSQYEIARRNYEQALDRYEQRVDGIRRPVFPTKLATVPMDELAAPADVVAVVEEPARTRRPRPTLKEPEAAEKPDESVVETVKLEVGRRASGPRIVRVAAFPVGVGLLLTASGALDSSARIDVTDTEGNNYRGELVRMDKASGLALVRVADLRLAPVPIADAIETGRIQCVSLAPSTFQPLPEVIGGTLEKVAGGTKLILPRLPSRSGAAVVLGGKIIAITVPQEDAEATSTPHATADALRKFLADDIAGIQAGANPSESPCELTITPP